MHGLNGIHLQNARAAGRELGHRVTARLALARFPPTLTTREIEDQVFDLFRPYMDYVVNPGTGEAWAFINGYRDGRADG